MTRACEMAGISRDTFYRWLREDADFKKAYEAAREEAIGTLEDEATRRACEGVERPVFQGGKQVGVIREYSDTLLILLLKALRPQKYRDYVRQEHTGADGAPLGPTEVRIVLVPTPTGLPPRTLPGRDLPPAPTPDVKQNEKAEPVPVPVPTPAPAMPVSAVPAFEAPDPNKQWKPRRRQPPSTRGSVWS